MTGLQIACWVIAGLVLLVAALYAVMALYDLWWWHRVDRLWAQAQADADARDAA